MSLYQDRMRGGTYLPWIGALAMALTALAIGAGWSAQGWNWVPSVGLRFEFAPNPYSDLYLAVVSAIGVAVFGFSARYLRSKAGAARFSAAMILFGLSMVGLILAEDVFSLFVFWELTTISSYLLIGHDTTSAEASKSARQAGLVTGAGGLVLLAGLVILADQAGSSRIADLAAAAPTSTAGWLMVLVGAMTKSAQVPFSGWLPRAMAAPTPASAFLHSATMVKAGIFLVGLLGPAAAALGWWTPTVLAIGLITVVVGGVGALRQTDLKLLLAYGTVSQLGLMFALIGSGVDSLIAAGLALLVAHALYKAALFLVVGAIESHYGTRTIGLLKGVRSEMPALAAVGLMAGASMGALPLTLGFSAKEAVLEAALAEAPLLAVLIATASSLTVAYTVRFLRGAFGGKATSGRRRGDLGLLWPPAALTIVGLALGAVPGVLGGPVSDAVGVVTGAVGAPPKLVIWPGLVPAFGLSMAGIVAGGWVGWATYSRAMSTRTKRWSFDGMVDLCQHWAERTTALIQSGSLPRYLGQITVVAVVLPAPALVRLGWAPEGITAGGVLEWITAVVVGAAALALLFVQRRMVAVLLLGAVGYGMSALFAIWGAPDVALTQVLVETLVVVFFALALRVLPAEFSTERGPVWWKAAIATGAGTFMAIVTMAAGGVTHPTPVSAQQVDLAVPAADGANVVNVTLVDFRAIDTLGEITVLAIAALGVLALTRPVGDRVRALAFGGRPSAILAKGAEAIGPLLWVFAAYLLLAGHNQAGGGFAAGLVGSGAVLLKWLSNGSSAVHRVLGIKPTALIGVGLALACAIGLGGLLWGEAILDSQAWAVALPLFGEVKFVTALLFDAGVALVVLGAVSSALRGLEAS